MRSTVGNVGDGRITFVQETAAIWILVFRPVYRGGVLPATLEQRRREVLGTASSF